MNLKVKRLKGIREKTFGLITADEAYPVLFNTRFGIHTFFMKFPIDVLVLDKENKVLTIKENLSRNRIFAWNPKYDTVIELPAGFIKRNKIEKRMTINLSWIS